MSGETVLIETSVEHAEALASLIDLATRIHLGQIEEVASLARFDKILVRRPGGSSEGDPITAGDADLLERYMQLGKSVLGHDANSSFGIGAKGVSIEAKRGYEVMKAIKKALHDHLRPEVRHTVDSDGVIVRYASGPVPTACIKKEDDARA